MDNTTTTCEECRLTYYYDPKYHECQTEESKALEARLLAGGGESWVDECMRKVGAKGHHKRKPD